jgi:hypothetical protein
MKRKRLLILFILPFVLFSCKDDNGPYIQIKNIENLIYLSIKEYRESNGENGPFVHQYFVVGEAQIYSYKMANGVEDVSIAGLTDHWNTLNSKYGFYNNHALVLKTESFDADEILTELLLQPDADSILTEDVTQCGVGVESDTAGFNYVTILLMKADS